MRCRRRVRRAVTSAMAWSSSAAAATFQGSRSTASMFFVVVEMNGRDSQRSAPNEHRWLLATDCGVAHRGPPAHRPRPGRTRAGSARPHQRGCAADPTRQPSGIQYLSLVQTERLAETGFVPPVGSIGYSRDSALAETVIGLRGPSARGNLSLSVLYPAQMPGLPGDRQASEIACLYWAEPE